MKDESQLKPKIDTETIGDAGFDKFMNRSGWSNVKSLDDYSRRKASYLAGGTIGSQGVIFIGNKLVKLDGGKRRMIIEDGLNSRILLGQREDGTFGIDVSKAGIEVIGAALADLLYSDRIATVGDVAGPATSTDEALARFDGASGTILQDSAATLSNAGRLSTTELHSTGETEIDGDLDHDGTRIGFFGTAPAVKDAVTDLTDNSGGSSGGDTIAAIDASITDPADTPLTADDLRDDLVANTIPDIEDSIQDIQNAVATLAAKTNEILNALQSYGIL